MSDDHEVRELRRRLRIANKTMGRQGQTIANLRGELARIREENSKIERGELRRLQRFEETAHEQFNLYLKRIGDLRKAMLDGEKEKPAETTLDQPVQFAQ